LAVISNNNLGGGLAGLGSERFNLFDDIHSFDNLSEDNVLAVQPGGLGRADEKLGAVGVGASVGHAQNAGSGVLQLEVLISKLGSVD
jgi:hypothetical protein